MAAAKKSWLTVPNPQAKLKLFLTLMEGFVMIPAPVCDYINTLVNKLPPLSSVSRAMSESFCEFYINKGVTPNSVILQPVTG